MSLNEIRDEVEGFLRSFPQITNPVSMAAALMAEVIEPALAVEAGIAATAQAEVVALRALVAWLDAHGEFEGTTGEPIVCRQGHELPEELRAALDSATPRTATRLA